MLKFDEKLHKYTWEGKPVPSVTQIMRVAGVSGYEDRQATSPALIKEAMEFGTNVHKVTAFDDLGTLDESTVDPQVMPCLQAWRKFKRDTGIVFTAIEKMVYSDKHFFAGTLDRYGHLAAGFKCLIDIKTGASLREHGIQLAAYGIGIKECYGWRPDKHFGVRLYVENGEGKYTLEDYTKDRATDAAAFLAANQIYKWKNLK
jgi:hypothetical protein